ncbi:uncharacterized protein [Leptinotarsa decemlineata]|uniref:uncharacterized protein n=1 Tax=Leptinotarsa decemlineata TaxID=7539 RepID=UPI003D30BD54
MNHLMQKLGYFMNFARPVEEKVMKVSKYEIYFEQMYKILNWEDNTLTLIVFLAFNLVFWIIVNWEIKLFGLLFTTFLVWFIWNSFFEAKDFSFYEAKYKEAFDEVCMYICEVSTNMRILRRDSPLVFCSAMCMICLLLICLSRTVSGYIIAYLLLLAIFFVPLGFKFLPDDYSEAIMKLVKSIVNVNGYVEVVAEEELIPFITRKDFGNKDNDLDSLLTDKTLDSVSNSLVSGISAMPSYLDVAEIQRDIEEDDLIPAQDIIGSRLNNSGDLSSDSDSDHKNINFESSQFDEDSSSEDEKLIGKGLQFSADVDNDNKLTTNFDLTGMLSNVASVGSALVANVLKSGVPTSTVERKTSGSDSDFEFINYEDLQ